MQELDWSGPQQPLKVHPYTMGWAWRAAPVQESIAWKVATIVVDQWFHKEPDLWTLMGEQDRFCDLSCGG